MKTSANTHALHAINNTNTVFTYNSRSTSQETGLNGQNKPSISKIRNRQFKNNNLLPYTESSGDVIKALSDWGRNHRKYINGK
jgi:hypothetical protein